MLLNVCVRRLAVLALGATCLVISAVDGGVIEAAPDPIPLELVADINTDGATTDIDHFVTVGDLTYFGADDGVHGRELWAYDDSDGTVEMVADLVPGPDGSSPTPGIGHDGTLYFSAYDDRGVELWSSRGTAGTTAFVADINSGVLGSYPSRFVVFRDQVHFVADDGVDESEIWRTDGTEAGTVQVSSIRPGGYARLRDLTVVQVTPLQSALYFSGDDGVIGNELHRYVPGAPTEFESWDLLVGADGSFPDSLSSIGGNAVAFGAGATGDRDLYIASGAGTVSFTSYDGSNDVDQVVAASGGIYASTRGASTGTLEFVTPTSGGLTVLRNDYAFDLTVVGDLLVYDGRAAALDGGIEPWVSDGTVGGTTQLIDAQPGDASAGEVRVISGAPSGEAWIIVEVDGTDRLYRTDGTSAGTIRLTAPPIGSLGFRLGATASGRTLFAIGDNGDEGLWSSDGVVDDAAQVDPINPNTASSDPTEFVEIGGQPFVSVNESSVGGELFALDPAGSATVVSDIAPGSAGSFPEQFTGPDDFKYFVSDDATNDEQVWRTDGTAGGTVRVTDLAPGASIRDLAGGPTRVFFESSGRVYAHDGSTIDLGAVDVFEIVSLGDNAFIRAAGSEYWISDGTLAGTGSLSTLVAEASGATFSQVTTFGGLAYLWDNSDLWVTDGTVSGTRKASGSVVGDVEDLIVNALGVWYVVVDSSGADDQWKVFHAADADSDGAEVGAGLVPPATELVAAGDVWSVVDVDDWAVIPFGGDGNSVEGLLVVDTTDGSPGDVRYIDLAAAGAPTDVDVDFGGDDGDRAYYVGVDGTGQRVVLSTDGTVDGTGVVVAFGWNSADRDPARIIGDRLYLTVDDPDVGVEPFSLLLPEAAPDPDPEPDPDPDPDPDPGVDIESLEPARLLDTRGTGETVDDRFEQVGRMAAGDVIELDVLGRAGVPSDDVGAVVLNVTMIRPDGNGFVTIHPCGDLPLASSMNAPAGGGVVANEVIAKVSTAGTVCLYSSVGTNLAADVTGFVPQGSAVASVEPARLLDTRGTGETVDDRFEQVGRMAAGDVIELDVLGRAGVPSDDVGAVVLNVTMIRPDGNGFVTISPCGDLPLASSMNAPAGGGVVANEVIAKVSEAGTVCLYSSVGTNLAADVTGFVPQGSAVASVEPARLLDTRGTGETVDDRFEQVGRMAAGDVIELDVLGRAGVPSDDVGAVVLNVTMIRPDGNGFVTISPCDVARPLASSMNAPAGGGVVANEVIAKVSAAGLVCLYSSVGTDLAADVTGYVAT